MQIDLGELKVWLCEVLARPELGTSMPDDVDLIDDIGLDSLQMVEFLLGIEERFLVEVEFEQLALDQVRSLDRLATFLSQQPRLDA